MPGTPELEAWVADCARRTQPDRIVWIDGSEREHDELVAQMLADDTLIKLNHDAYPGSYLHRSDPNDVARTEHLTYICCEREADAGPNNNWMDPKQAKEDVGKLFDGAMRGRTMYVIPYLMCPPGSPQAKVGIEVTDSPYVVANMRIMTRMGDVALRELEKNGGEFYPGLHSLGDLSPERRFILHFPEERLVWSIGSGYGGNALLGKKCLSLRIASWMAWKQNWMAEHMLILGLQDPSGNVHYMAGAFPSACGKTNLAMLVSPLADLGWKVWTVGDDIAWLRIRDGKLYAVNPEAGYFGVAPGTNLETNPNAMQALSHGSIFTNVALTPDGKPWWEGIDPEQTTPPPGTLDWHGNVWKPGDEPAAHPNSRFTTPAANNPNISSKWEDPEGVPISAFIFGGRRANTAPLVYQAFDWPHGVFVGAGMGSETTAAAAGEVGKVRRDPMAMLPFCGYNMGDYFGHWLDIGTQLTEPPAVFHVNWFRKGPDGEFLWPGFGQNIRVLMWMLERTQGKGKAVTTPIGHVPTVDGLYLDGLNVTQEQMEQALAVDPSEWEQEWAEQGEFFSQFGDHLPAQVTEQHNALKQRLDAVKAETRA